MSVLEKTLQSLSMQMGVIMDTDTKVDGEFKAELERTKALVAISNQVIGIHKVVIDANKAAYVIGQDNSYISPDMMRLGRDKVGNDG